MMQPTRDEGELRSISQSLMPARNAGSLQGLERGRKMRREAYEIEREQLASA
jgi:hypothetical protein